MHLGDHLNPTNVRDVNKAKMKGQFKVDMKKSFSPVQRVQSFANDYLSYYMHKNNHFLKHISQEKTVDEIKKEKSNKKMAKLLQKYSNIDKELELNRKKKLDKVRQFYAEREQSYEKLRSKLDKIGVSFENQRLSTLMDESIQMEES